MKKSMTKVTTLKTLIVASPLLVSAAFAAEQPNAQDLVGKTYVGAHLMHINTDNDRLMSADPLSAIEHGNGFGAEIGYRWTENTEFRFSASKINLVSEHDGYTEPNGSAVGVDALYFPTKQNFYVLGGVDYLDVIDAKASLAVGAGYRHYLSERSAIYLEGKGYYQFADHFQDTSAKLGFIYFFGDTAKARPAKKAQPVTAKTDVAPVIIAKDSDKDSVVDSKDNCANTPMEDKVDSKGCTIFSEENIHVQLLVNFDNNKAVVKPEYFAEIKRMADFLTTYTHTSLVIEGHTSKVGGAAYNKKISQKRADAVMAVLVNEFGIDASRLSATGYGEERLLVEGNDAASHAKNRRIEATVETTEKVSIKR